MGFFSDLFGGGSDPEKIEQIAEDVERYADRFENADDEENAALARGYAERIRRAKSVKGAKKLKVEFLAIINKDEIQPSRDRDYHQDRNTRYSDDS
jgi:hypothetical protein